MIVSREEEIWQHWTASRFLQEHKRFPASGHYRGGMQGDPGFIAFQQKRSHVKKRWSQATAAGLTTCSAAAILKR